MPITEHPILAAADARAVLTYSGRDAALHAGVSLMLLVGLRASEVTGLRVSQYAPGPQARVHVGTDRHSRTIRIAPSAARALDTYLATQRTDPHDYLLPELGTTRVVQMVRGVAAAAGISAGVHDLRRAAWAAVLEDGTPVWHAEAYFGRNGARPRQKDHVPLPEGYDAAISGVLEQAFA